MEYLKKVNIACKLNHYTFEELAKRLKISAEELTDELTTGTITINRLERISKCLGCCFSCFFTSKIK